MVAFGWVLKRSTCRFSLALTRGSYISAHVLLNLLNKLGKTDKMRDLPSILSLFSQRVIVPYLTTNIEYSCDQLLKSQLLKSTGIYK